MMGSDKLIAKVNEIVKGSGFQYEFTQDRCRITDEESKFLGYETSLMRALAESLPEGYNGMNLDQIWVKATS